MITSMHLATEKPMNISEWIHGRGSEGGMRIGVLQADRKRTRVTSCGWLERGNAIMAH